jgi:hypothetical protein
MPTTLHSVNNEFCVLIGGTPSVLTNCELYQLIEVDSAFLDPRNIKVYHGRKCLKFKTKIFKQGKWIDYKAETLRGEFLLRFKFKSKLCDGDSIIIEEQKFPSNDYSLMTKITISPFNQTRLTIQNSRIRSIIEGTDTALSKND